MRPTPFRRSYLGIAGLTVVALIVSVLASTSAPQSVSAAPAAEPRFWEWGDEPFSDDLNHYLVTVEAIAGDSWLQVDDSTLVAAATPPHDVSPSHIDDVVTGDAGVDRSAAEIVGELRSHPLVSSVRPLAFDIYAVAGEIAIEDLADLPGITSATLDRALDAATVDPYYPNQWGLENDGQSDDGWTQAPDADIDAPEGWHRTRGEGVVVAVVDSGVDITHPDLVNNIWRNSGEQCGNGIDDDGNGYVDDCNGWNFAAGSAAVTDNVGHGTHVAGIIAAEADNRIGIAGVAYEADIMPLKIGDTPSLSAAIEAIAYAIDNGARVINASWGVNDPNAAAYLDVAITAAEQAGVLVVTAAGNEPVNIDTAPWYPAASSLDNVITVAASTPTDQPASWSGYGATNVDIFAPGEFIVSTLPGGYGVYSGTSMAAPMVAGAAALLWAATPEATYQEVKGALLDRSDGPNDGVTSFRDLATSEGRLNIDRSIYSAPLFQPSLMYHFYEFSNFEPDLPHKVAITAKTVDPWIVPPQTPAMYRAGLYVPVDGEPMAVVGHEITYTGEGGDLAVTTDATGRALVGRVFERQQRPAFVQDGDFTPLAMELPAGTYAFVMEVVDISDREQPITLGDPSAVFFRVTADGEIEEMPQIPLGGSDPEPATTTTQAPVSTSTVPATSTTSGTTPTTTPTSTTTTTGAISPTTTTVVSVTTTTSGPATTTTTTSAPTTTSPATTTTTTGAPPVATTTTTTAPATTTTTPAGGVGTTTTTSTTTTTVSPSGMAITGVNPAEGPVVGRTLATITGRELPELVDVFFGDQRAEIISVTAPTFIVVDTPPGEPGWVNVRVVDRVSGDEAVMDNAFLYINEGEEPPPTTTTTTSTTIWSPATTTTLGGGQPTTTTPVVTTIPVTPTTTVVPVNPFDELNDWRDSLLQTPEGLTLAPPAADDPINSLSLDVWIGAFCDEPICPGWVLED